MTRFCKATAAIAGIGAFNAALCFVPPARWYNIFCAGMCFGILQCLLTSWWVFRKLVT